MLQRPKNVNITQTFPLDIYSVYLHFDPELFKCLEYCGVTNFRGCKEQCYISVCHMHALSKEIEHMYK